MSDKQQTAVTPIVNTYAVTGEHHGSIVQATTKEEAESIFQKHYNGEKILITKDISNYNLENL
jgi:hypothetical protein